MKITFKYQILFLFVVLILASCNNENPTPTIARLSIFQACKGLDQVNLTSGGTYKYNATPLKYLDYTAYKTLSAGKRNISISKAGATSELSKVTIDIKPRMSYTSFVIGTATSPTLLITEDDLNPAVNKSKIRFVHLKENIKDVDVYINGENNALYTKILYKSASIFKEIDATDNLRITLKENGQIETIVDFTKIKVEKGKIYTFVISDSQAGNSAKLALTSVINL